MLHIGKEVNDGFFAIDKKKLEQLNLRILVKQALTKIRSVKEAMMDFSELIKEEIIAIKFVRI